MIYQSMFSVFCLLVSASSDGEMRSYVSGYLKANSLYSYISLFDILLWIILKLK